MDCVRPFNIPGNKFAKAEDTISGFSEDNKGKRAKPRLVLKHGSSSF